MGNMEVTSASLFFSCFPKNSKKSALKKPESIAISMFYGFFDVLANIINHSTLAL